METVIYLSTCDCSPPHKVKDYNKVENFVDMFEKEGFDKSKPCLIGYPHEGKIQLLSGSHRWAAANILKMKVPVVLWLKSDIEKAWGDLDKWKVVMKETKVEEKE